MQLATGNVTNFPKRIREILNKERLYKWESDEGEEMNGSSLLLPQYLIKLVVLLFSINISLSSKLYPYSLQLTF